MSFYVASGLANIPTVRKVIKRCLAIGGFGELTYDWTTHGGVYGQGEEVYQSLANVELRAVLRADYVFVVLPGGRGTHVELGAALASGKTITLLRSAVETADKFCVFHHHPALVQLDLETFLGE